MYYQFLWCHWWRSSGERVQQRWNYRKSGWSLASGDELQNGPNPGWQCVLCLKYFVIIICSGSHLLTIIFCFLVPQFYVCGFPNDNYQRVRRLAVARTRFMIRTLTAHFTRIAVGDCRDGILFFSYHEVSIRSTLKTLSAYM